MCSVLLQVDEAPLVGDPLPIFGNKREFDSHNIFFCQFLRIFLPPPCVHTARRVTLRATIRVSELYLLQLLAPRIMVCLLELAALELCYVICGSQ
jgi:hypothetical protein